MDARALTRHARPAVIWLGPALLIAGLLNRQLWSQWHSGRMGELLVIALVAFATCRFLARRCNVAEASLQVLFWLALLAVFAGPAAVFATALFLLACLALGSMVCPRAPVALQGLAGALVVAGVMGWLLQVPIHHAAVYLVACVALVALRRRAVAETLRTAKLQWDEAVSASPRWAVFALVVLGLASTGSWPPTLQFDDLAYHLGLPWQLQTEGVYRPDPRLQVWALAPWATDILHAIPQLMTGREARGPVNLAWLAVLGCGVWQLCRQLGASASLAWLSVALVASLPLTAALAGGMHTELPTAATLVWLARVVSAPPSGETGFWVRIAILAAGLVAMKTTAAAMAAVLLVWALLRHPWPRPDRILWVLGIGLALAASSYVFAYLMTGNPVLPLFNAWFGSPYFALSNTLDLRWQAGFDAALPWDLTFHTDRYGELFAGGAGFLLVALAGAWLVSLVHRDLRPLAVVAGLVLVIPLVPVQYLRYAYPGLVLLVPVAMVAAGRSLPSSVTGLAVALCVLNLAFQANSHWMLRTGLLKQTVLAFGKDAPVFAGYAPERTLAALIREQSPAARNVLFLSADQPWFAELGQRGRSPTWYAPGLQAAAQAADRDASGQAWVRLIAQEQVGEIVLRRSQVGDAQRRALQDLQARHRATVGDAEWWSLPE